jgi:malic enzyme
VQEVDGAALRRAAQALADLVREPGEQAVLPGVFDDRVVPAVAGAVAPRDE